MKQNKNSEPTSEWADIDCCPSCGDPCNIHQDLDEKDLCNNCRPSYVGVCTTGTCEKCECPEEKTRIRVKMYHDSIFTLGVYIRSSEDEKSWHDLRWFPKSRIDVLTPAFNVMEIAVPVWLLEKENIINLVKRVDNASNK